MSRFVGPHADRPRNDDFGRRLTEHRRRLRLNQSDVANRLSQELGRSVNAGRISEWEQGQRNPQPEEYKALARILCL